MLVGYYCMMNYGGGSSSMYCVLGTSCGNNKVINNNYANYVYSCKLGVRMLVLDQASRPGVTNFLSKQ